MDKRAERRQARLERKIWRIEGTGKRRERTRMQIREASNLESTDCGGRMGGGQNMSEEESNDDITIYEDNVNPPVKDLEAKLHLSDARGLKWQKIAEERSEKIKELQTEIECLNLKIKEIMDGKAAARHGPADLKLRTENQGLKEKNKELLQTLDRLHKQCSATVETLSQVLQDTKCHEQQNNHHQTSKRTGTPAKNGYESTTDVNGSVEQLQTNGYLQHLGKNASGSVPQAAANGGPNENPNESHLETTKKPVNVAKIGYDSTGDVVIDLVGQSCEEDLGVPNKLGGNRRPLGDPAEDVPEPLFTSIERKCALALVEQAFLGWLNSRVRRPTAKEMTFHKSQLSEKARPVGKESSFYWTGIPGSLLLDKFYEETNKPKPKCFALTDLLRTVLHVEGSKRTNDMLWCLVWTDCMNPEQLPGYVYHPQEKRLRAADLEDAFRAVKTRHS